MSSKVQIGNWTSKKWSYSFVEVQIDRWVADIGKGGDEGRDSKMISYVAAKG